jgi:hypothetical protein
MFQMLLVMRVLFFQRWFRGERLGDEQLQQLKAEDDTATITLNGQLIRLSNQPTPGIIWEM